jgi:hypothetical protein
MLTSLLEKIRQRGQSPRQDPATVRPQDRGAAMRLFQNQDAAMTTLIAQVENCARIELLEYAATTTQPLIRAIRQHRVPLRLLVKHPETVEGMQRERTLTTLDTMYRTLFDAYDGDYEIRCYRLPYSLRGRHFEGKALELGWLTPNRRGETTHGSANPSLFFLVSDSQHAPAINLFVRTFKDYWEDPDTEAATEVLQRHSASPTGKHGRAR